MVTTHDEETWHRLVSMRNQGRADGGGWLDHARLGYNYRIDDISAALGIGQLEKLDRILSMRTAAAARYGELLAGIDGLEIPLADDADHVRSWFVYVVTLARGTDRERVIARARAARGSRPRATSRRSISRPTCASATASPRGSVRSRRISRSAPSRSRSSPRSKRRTRNESPRRSRPRWRSSSSRQGEALAVWGLYALEATATLVTYSPAVAGHPLQRRLGGRSRRRPLPHADGRQLPARARCDRAGRDRRRPTPARLVVDRALCAGRGPGSGRPGRSRRALDQRSSRARSRARPRADGARGQAGGAAFVRRARGDPLRLVLGVALLLLALPWVAAETRLLLPRRRLHGRGDPARAGRRARRRAPRLPSRHGRRRARVERAPALAPARAGERCAATSRSCSPYGLANAVQDGWNEQLWKRGTVDHHLDSVLRPELSARLARDPRRRCRDLRVLVPAFASAIIAAWTVRMVFLGFGKYARADKIYALQPITGDDRGGGQRTLVWVEGVADPIIASRDRADDPARHGPGARQARRCSTRRSPSPSGSPRTRRAAASTSPTSAAAPGSCSSRRADPERRRSSSSVVITAVHTLIYSDDAAATRAFFRDVLRMAVRGGGRLGLADLPDRPQRARRPSDFRDAQCARRGAYPRHHSVSLMCDDVEATVVELEARGSGVRGRDPGFRLRARDHAGAARSGGHDARTSRSIRPRTTSEARVLRPQRARGRARADRRDPARRRRRRHDRRGRGVRRGRPGGARVPRPHAAQRLDVRPARSRVRLPLVRDPLVPQPRLRGGGERRRPC